MLLELSKVRASYGHSQVLFGVSLGVDVGEIVTLIGRNGMGKTTTVRTIMGLVVPTAGEILFHGERISHLPSHKIARRGLGLVPEGRHIFPNLTVRENLLMAEANRKRTAEPWTADRVLGFFPRLRERLNNWGTELSGGEQQMLAIGRALVTNPTLLILDEATEGLAPIIREEIWERLEALKGTGQSILIIDKELDALCKLADRHYVLEKGEVVWSGDTEALQSNARIQEAYLGI